MSKIESAVSQLEATTLELQQLYSEVEQQLNDNIVSHSTPNRYQAKGITSQTSIGIALLCTALGLVAGYLIWGLSA